MNATARLHRSKIRRAMTSTFVTAFAAAILVIYLIPFLYMILTSLKTKQQMTVMGTPIWPAQIPSFTFKGENKGTYTFKVHKGGMLVNQVVDLTSFVDRNMDIFIVPLANGIKKNLALVVGFQQDAIFLDPKNPSAAPILWSEGYYKALPRPWIFSPTWSNYTYAWQVMKYPRMFLNTLLYTVSTLIGILFSCILVAYGFSRFRFPGRDFWFVVLISTLFLPGAVTLIPTYLFWYKVKMVGTWIPLILPSFFSNPYDTFLLRQFFMTLPRELDEAATMDGAGPFRILWSVILPQSYPAILAVSIFHIVWTWNDYFGPMIYLSTKMDNQPISVALARFNYFYGSDPQYIQAGSLMALIIPLIVFVLAQRFFIQGIVITGVEK